MPRRRINHGAAGKRQRREDAIERQSIRDAMSPKDQLVRLDALFGVDVGAMKERLRLLSQILDRS